METEACEATCTVLGCLITDVIIAAHLVTFPTFSLPNCWILFADVKGLHLHVELRLLVVDRSMIRWTSSSTRFSSVLTSAVRGGPAVSMISA